LFAVDRTGMAADAGVEVHDQTQLLGPRLGLRQHCHDALSATSLTRNGLAPRRGAVSAGACAPHRSIDTVTSNQAAWPVTGSEFECGASPLWPGKYSEMTWLSRNPRRNSGASAFSAQAPARLPIAFQVHTVSRLTPLIVRA